MAKRHDVKEGELMSMADTDNVIGLKQIRKAKRDANFKKSYKRYLADLSIAQIEKEGHFLQRKIQCGLNCEETQKRLSLVFEEIENRVNCGSLSGEISHYGAGLNTLNAIGSLKHEY